MDAGQDETVGQTVAARAAEDPRIRYQKLEKNEGIAGNTNQALRWQRASSSPCWTTMISCTPVLCGTWHRPLPNRVQTLCIRMK